MEEEKIISVRHLKKYYPIPKALPFQREREYVKAVDDISFDLYKGETLGIVGESGSGKSTIARLVNRLIKPTEGEIYFRDQEITTTSKEEMKGFRRAIQMVFQSPYGTLDPRKTIGYSLMEPYIIHQIGSREERLKNVHRLLEMVDLPASSANKYPHEFSGGQLQRINISRAVALQPEILICDESVSALDVSVQAQILNLLNQLQEEMGLSYLFISHDLNVVRYMCDRIIVMNQGKIIEMGPSKEVYNQPQTEYTKSLLQAIPISSPYERMG
ncbi:ATP-binding cassette domain-containing protein [Jeotgalibaca sp. MA1X17-3]|uniref:ABC transporter ATP-binding protein n=1 Tax=Jeotgalibaca sp. MA1X17-3 TaxID=2908211 RepID=UPI001F34B662|nr:ATP-binding cassette domain-containing protein [Jeotgalibaca sp. MA1X17-3]UJF15373.1 ATP-binding cassette domain-containing protein [Jeotgalibaca sp. MA1X17-3]